MSAVQRQGPCCTVIVFWGNSDNLWKCRYEAVDTCIGGTARFSVRCIARHSRHAYVTWRRPLQRGVRPTPHRSRLTHSFWRAQSRLTRSLPTWPQQWHDVWYTRRRVSLKLKSTFWHYFISVQIVKFLIINNLTSTSNIFTHSGELTKFSLSENFYRNFSHRQLEGNSFSVYDFFRIVLWTK